MSTLKLLLHLNSRYHVKPLFMPYLINKGSLIYKQLRFVSECCSLQTKHSPQNKVTIKDVEYASDDGDYFGVENYTGIRNEEKAREKEAWLRGDKISPSQNENESLTENHEESSVEKPGQYKSELVNRLVTTAYETHQPNDIIVARTYGIIRYDKKKPEDIVKQKSKVKKKDQGVKVQNTETKTNRFSNIPGKSVRKSLRTPGNRYEMLKSSKSLTPKNGQDGTEQDLTSFFDDQYFQYGSKDEQIDTVSQTDMDRKQTEKQAKKLKRSEQIGGTVSQTDMDKSQTVKSEKFKRMEKSNIELNEDSLSSTRDYTSEENDFSYIDQQYFMKQSSKKANARKESTPFASSKTDALDFVDAKKSRLKFVGKDSKSNDQSGLDYVDNQYFNYDPDPDIEKNKAMKGVTKGKVEKGAKLKAFVHVDGDKSLGNTDEQSFGNNIDRSRTEAIKGTMKKVFAVTAATDRRSDGKNKSQQKTPSSVTKKEPDRAKTPETAHEVAMQKRAELEAKSGRRLYGKMNPKEEDEKGFRIMKGQVPNFTNVPSCDIADLLRQSIVYDDNDIVAINKPYGLNSRHSSGTKVSVEHLLGDILPSTTLHLVSGIGKETTGVVLLAKTTAMAKELQEALNQEECIKRYLVVTKNVPTMPKGEINIPIADGMVDGKVRKTLKPYGDSDMGISSRLSNNAERAVTRYEVLDQQARCALLECKPLTNVKHQIRAHLAFGLNCPILGDHKYSHLDRIAPMKLHPEMLDRFHVRQSKVRHIAMHIHARSVVIPEFFNGRNFVVSAPLSSHFVKNLKYLKLRLPPRK